MDILIRKELIVKYAKAQNGHKKEGMFANIVSL